MAWIWSVTPSGSSLMGPLVVISIVSPTLSRTVADSLGNVGFIVVGLFVVFWAAAASSWKIDRVEQRWSH